MSNVTYNPELLGVESFPSSNALVAVVTSKSRPHNKAKHATTLKVSLRATSKAAHVSGVRREEMLDQYRHLNMPAELAIEFMAAFSRAEYALKSAGFACGHANKVEPAWDIFANEIHDEFMSVKENSLVEASNYLLELPPRKQVLVNQEVKFRDQKIDENQRRTQQIFLMIRTVRNNLFHGGKYLPYGEVEVGRNEKLVQSALCVLMAAISLNEKVRVSFEI